jgi:PKD repeat protein
MIRESGVSNVVGVILLLFLVMVTSAVLGLVLSSATYDAVDTTPDVIFTVSEDPHLLYHGGGDILYKNDLVFYAGGYDISEWILLEDEGNIWSNLWTEWHTGQAINTVNTGYVVSELTIVALDSRGNAYLVYNGPTADPIPGGKPVPDVTPKPTVTPTPSPVTPDASFTLTSVDVGQEVSLGILPSSLVNNTTDHFVVMERDWLLGYYYEADVKFTANENNLLYAWSVLPGVYINNASSRSPTLTFEESGLYTVTLAVTNTTSGLSNSSTQIVSVRNPGITAMMWIKQDGWFQKVGKDYYYYPSFEAYNNLSSWSKKWEFTGQSSTNLRNNNKYDFEFNLGSSSGSVQSDRITLNKDTWYHVTGTFEESRSSIFTFDYLYIYINGSIEETSTTFSSLAYTDEGVFYFDNTSHFDYNQTLVHDIPFAMTADEIAAVYNAENLDGHR